MQTEIKEESKVSVSKLQKHIFLNHPKMDNAKSYPLCSNTGQMIKFNRKTEIPNIMKDIGLGASIYLYMLKYKIYLFVFLTIINLPVIFLFLSGDERAHRDRIEVSSFLQMFSVGNLGQSSRIDVSHEIHFNKNESLKL